MAISTDLLKLVPVGEENAVPGLLLWKQLNMWSPASIKHNLQQMADNGLIERKRVPRGAARDQFVFQIAQLISAKRNCQ
jgi:predicted transcriptional regulator